MISVDALLDHEVAIDGLARELHAALFVPIDDTTLRLPDPDPPKPGFKKSRSTKDRWPDVVLTVEQADSIVTDLARMSRTLLDLPSARALIVESGLGGLQPGWGESSIGELTDEEAHEMVQEVVDREGIVTSPEPASEPLVELPDEPHRRAEDVALALGLVRRLRVTTEAVVVGRALDSIRGHLTSIEAIVCDAAEPHRHQPGVDGSKKRGGWYRAVDDAFAHPTIAAAKLSSKQRGRLIARVFEVVTGEPLGRDVARVLRK